MKRLTDGSETVGAEQHEVVVEVSDALDVVEELDDGVAIRVTMLAATGKQRELK